MSYHGQLRLHRKGGRASLGPAARIRLCAGESASGSGRLFWRTGELFCRMGELSWSTRE